MWQICQVLFLPRAAKVLDHFLASLEGSIANNPQLLELAAEQGRIVISRDRRTMTHHYREGLAAGKSSPGLFIVRQRGAIGEIVESLLLIWSASRPEEWHNGIHYLPLR